MSLPKYLRDNQDTIDQQEPLKQCINYCAKNWEKRFPDSEALNSIMEINSHSISRKDIFNIKKKLGANPSAQELEELFLAVMIWGFGTIGYGAWRTKEMFDSQNFSQTIKDAFNAIQQDNIKKAYEIFNSKKTKLERCGFTFSTKYFYFCGEQKKNVLMPLTLDSRVTKAIKGLNIKITRSKKGYMKYLKDMNNWAEQLEVEPHQIEFFLFKYEGEEVDDE